MLFLAQSVVREDVNDPALANVTGVAGRHDARQLPLEPLQTVDAIADRDEMRRGDAVGFVAWLFRVFAQARQVADGFDGEPKIAGMAELNNNIQRTQMLSNIREAARAAALSALAR